jgi:hypothetical protein
MVRNVALVGLSSIQVVNQRYFIPMQSIEAQIPYVQRRSDKAAAQSIAKQLRIPGQGGRDSGVDPVSIPKLIRSRFRDEAGHGFRF